MESTLSLQKKDLAGEIGFFLGYGRGSDFGEPTWTMQQSNAIKSCLDSGCRKFYFPPPEAGKDSPYDWSFLKPVVTIDLPVGGSVVPLPDDYGGFEGDVTILSLQSQVTWPIPLVGEGQVRQRFSQDPLSTGRPLVAAEQPLRGTTATTGQRFQLIFYPLFDADYQAQFAYYVLPDCLTPAFPYCLGGMAHAETILESCLSIAEQRLDDSGGNVHAANFNERLMASIGLDRRDKPQKLGYNRDLSDGISWNRRDLHELSTVRVNGVSY